MSEDLAILLTHEARVIKRIADLRKDGMWMTKKPGLGQVALGEKAHWDNLLTEMVHMWSLFRNEKVWKEKNSKKCGTAIKNHFRNEYLKASRQEKEEEQQRKKLAVGMAKMVMQFWGNAGKIVNFKILRLHDIGRRQVLDNKLNEVLKSSEKIGLSLEEEEEEEIDIDGGEDAEFKEPESESDLEETIEKEEQLEQLKASDYRKEIAELEDENNLSVEELLKKYEGYKPLHDLPKSSSSGRKRRKLDSETSQQEESGDGESFGLSSLLKKAESKDCEEFQPSGYTLESTNITITRPVLLSPELSLREYQYIGVDWLVNLYNKDLNGILADEMGLGKTIQTIALLAYLAEVEHNWGPHLIIVPSSILMNWEVEMIKWCPGFKILTYCGSQKQRKEQRRGWSVPNSFQICITSYAIAIQDHRCFRRKDWQYMILDEAHHIKNFNSQRWQVLLNFNTKRRLLLTGTPLQNNIMELWSLLHFLMPHMFESHSEFKNWFSKPIEEIVLGGKGSGDQVVKQFHKTLRPFMLRRLKSEVEKQMPKKIEHVVKCPLSKRQRLLYEEFMARAETKRSLNSGSFVSMLGNLMQLRKVCNHPDLFEPRPIVSPLLMEPVSIALPKLVWDIDTQANNPLNVEFMGYPNREVSSSRNIVLTYFPDASWRVLKSSEGEVVNVAVEPVDYPDVVVAMTRIEGRGIGSGMASIWRGTFQEKNFSASESDEGQENMQPLVMADLDDNLPVSQSTTSWGNSQSSATDYSPSQDVKEVQPNDSLLLSQNDDNSSTISSITNFRSDNSIDYTLEYIENRKRNAKKRSFDALRKTIQWRSQTSYILDMNLVQACTILGRLPSQRSRYIRHRGYRKSAILNGYAAVMAISAIREANVELFNHPDCIWNFTECLKKLVQSMEAVLNNVNLDLIMYIPAVGITSSPEKTIYNPTGSCMLNRTIKNRDNLKEKFSRLVGCLYPVMSRFVTSFPDSRLVEYDCGKLRVLNGLMRELKQGGHKVLLFTQMTKVLDMLEAFLNHQGFKYLRMDGGTRIDQRQLLVDRFNKDPKIFCFLLSTRAGGLGINLTGADTVIFYDSDWNPTIDAQAQDRCHRIGQTRDVHIYRLISENTVEENILKTSTHKRMLGEHAIEDGKFNLTGFGTESFRSIFGLDTRMGGKVLVGESCEDLVQRDELEKALEFVEDDMDDRNAAEAVKNEVKAEANEFREEIPQEETKLQLDTLKNDLNYIYDLCNEVERYAINSIDATFPDWSDKLIDELTKVDDSSAVPSKEPDSNQMKLNPDIFDLASGSEDLNTSYGDSSEDESDFDRFSSFHGDGFMPPSPDSNTTESLSVETSQSQSSRDSSLNLELRIAAKHI